jgi:integrase/recombinase XerD
MRQFLNSYENMMVAQDNSRTSVEIFLRATRKIFNQAIEDGIIDKEIYPFKKHKIPTGKNTKKAIESPDIKKLFNVDVKETLSGKSESLLVFYLSMQWNEYQGYF